MHTTYSKLALITAISSISPAMSDQQTPPEKKYSADWFMRGALVRIGESLDRLTGRKWSPSSSLATSEIIERVNKLLDAEAVEVPGKGKVVPHQIRLKMQWDKFSDDAEDAIKKLQNEILAAAVDHINNSLYYTYGPVSLEVKPDYFVEGVKLYVSFGEFSEDDEARELNVTVPGMNIDRSMIPEKKDAGWTDTVVARSAIDGTAKEKRLEITAGSSISIGRASSCDLVLDDASVSKIHASLTVSEDGVISIADTGSTNGTYINEQRIAYGKAMALAENDKLKFGEIEVTLEKLPRQTAEPEPAPDDEEASVEIDGLEFRRRTSAPVSAETAPVISGLTEGSHRPETADTTFTEEVPVADK